MSLSHIQARFEAEREGAPGLVEGREGTPLAALGFRPSMSRWEKNFGRMKNPGTVQLNAILRPSNVPTLVLIRNVVELTLPVILLDQLYELTLECIYEARGPTSLQEWLSRIERLSPEQQGQLAASRIRDDVSLGPRTRCVVVIRG